MSHIQSRSAADMEEEAKAWSRDDLLRVWDHIKARQPLDGWLRGKAFEYFVIRAFDVEGLRVKWPYVVTYRQKLGIVEQNDGFIYLGDRPFLVESKDLSDPLEVESVAKLRFRLESRPPGTMSVLFNSTRFSLATEVFAQFAVPLNVVLWRGQDFDYALPTASMAAGLQAKLDAATERGTPLFPLE
ncbi:MAG TPA: hypothetical protein VFJ16_13600 [Longimicrobium sp.]|nr:hypothetical protein [Longimicrobium sp.]